MTTSGTAAARATVSWSSRPTAGEKTQMPASTKEATANTAAITIRTFQTLSETSLGRTDARESAAELGGGGEGLGCPLIERAGGGGGGKGRRGERGAEEAGGAFGSARREGQAYFSDPTVYLERFIEDPRHVEVQ